jgi:sugar lactone lactonase YvrE
MSLEATLRLDAACTLGEGIAWHTALPGFPRGTFIFVDIHGRKVHALCPDSGRHQSWSAPERIGWLIQSSQAGILVAGLQSGFARVRLGADSVEIIDWIDRIYADRPALRLNDAKADSAGRIWAGSLNNDDESRPDGELFCLDPKTEHAVMVDSGYGVANGPAISPDGRLMLHTDSARQTIHAFDFDEGSGILSGKRTWKTLSAAEGYPDGMTFDAQGRLWLAHWGAGLLSQYEIDGTLRQRIQLPVSNVTNVAFGGPRYDRLYVTTARAGLSDAALQAQPLAGAVFEIIGHDSVGLPAQAAGF